MREAIGSTWLFQIVIVFIILFTGYMCLSINHSKAFAVKDDIIEIIERNNGIDLKKDASGGNKTLKEIAARLKTSGYRTNGRCSTLSQKNDSSVGEWHGFDREGNSDQGGNNSTFCVREMNVSNNIQTRTADGIEVSELPVTVYYQIGVFYQLDLPVLNYLWSFSLKGDTRIIYNPNYK